MTLAARPEEVVSPPTHDRLFAEILTSTGVDLNAYVEKKAGWLRTLGYEAGVKAISFKSEVKTGEIVDAMLGLASVEIKDVTISSLRFGIEIKEEHFTSGIASIRPTAAGDCRIVVTSRKDNGKAEVKGKVFVPAIPDLPSEHMKFRVVGTVVQAIAKPPKCAFTFNLSPDVPYEIDDLTHSVNFVCMAAKPGTKVELFRNRNRFASAVVERRPKLAPFYPSLLFRLRLVRSFMDLAGVRENMLVRARDVFEQDEALCWIKVALSRTKQTVNMKVDFYKPPKVTKWTRTFARPVILKLNDAHLIAFCYWRAQFAIDPPLMAATIDRCKIWDTMFPEIEAPETVQAAYADYEAFCTRISKGNLFLQTFDVQSRGSE